MVGLAILIVTVLIKIAFFPLANKSYASMAKMKAVKAQMTTLRALSRQSCREVAALLPSLVLRIYSLTA